jgi:hypothetical protein
MNTTTELNKLIVLHGNCRGALNVTLAKLHQAESEIATLKEVIQQDEQQTMLCACRFPGFDVNNPAVCPTCNLPHRKSTKVNANRLMFQKGSNMQIDEVLEWARDGKWGIIETHPYAIEEAFEQLADLRAKASMPVNRCVKCEELFGKENLSVRYSLECNTLSPKEFALIQQFYAWLAVQARC